MQSNPIAESNQTSENVQLNSSNNELIKRSLDSQSFNVFKLKEGDILHYKSKCVHSNNVHSLHINLVLTKIKSFLFRN